MRAELYLPDGSRTQTADRIGGAEREIGDLVAAYVNEFRRLGQIPAVGKVTVVVEVDQEDPFRDPHVRVGRGIGSGREVLASLVGL